ncbi:MAG: hypothetical protein ABJA71_07570 [Ginsengibacter sp.]
MRQREPKIIIEFDVDLKTGRVVGMGEVIIGKIENPKQYRKELGKAIAFANAYLKKQQSAGI